MHTESEYEHTQYGPWSVLLYPLAVLFIALAVFLPDFPLRYIFLPIGLLLPVLASSVHYLSIEDKGNHLSIHFGPLRLFNRRINYDDIVSVEAGRTTLLDGWGIHRSLRGGWVWNIWGRDCVVIRLRNEKFFLGTNDIERLLNHLNSRVTGRTNFEDLIVQ